MAGFPNHAAAVARIALAAALLWGGVGVVLVASSPKAQACPMCREILNSDHDEVAGSTQSSVSDNMNSGGGMAVAPSHDPLHHPALAEGFYYSILFMITAVLGVPLGLGVMCYRAFQNSRAYRQRLNDVDASRASKAGV